MSSLRERAVDERAMHVTSVFQKTGDHAVLDHEADSDEEVLLALGYKQEFKRDFSIWTSFAVSFSVLGLLPSVASTLSYNLAFSGPAGSVWGWFVACIPIQFIALSIAELCSSMPTAGGLYYASAVLAPEGWGPLCSWVCNPPKIYTLKPLLSLGQDNRMVKFYGLGHCSLCHQLRSRIHGNHRSRNRTPYLRRTNLSGVFDDARTPSR